LEEQVLLAEKPAAEDKQLHAALLSTAIASGEGLLLEGADAETLRRSSSRRKRSTPNWNRCASHTSSGTPN